MHKNSLGYFALIFAIICVSYACGGDKPALALDNDISQSDSTLDLNRSFLYKKNHTWGDSLQIMVLSWGTDTLGGYLILLSDSSKQNYTATSHFRNGPVMRSWVDDLDRDSYPEVAVVVSTMNYRQTGHFTLHEFDKDYSLDPIEMEPLNEQLGAEYDGQDSIYAQQGQVVREFSLAKSGADSLEPDSLKNKRRILYQLENNSLIVTDYEDL